MEVPLTFVDFAITEARFRKHFRIAPPDTWNEKMVPLAEFLKLDEGAREGRFPYVWSVDSKQHLTRLLVDRTMVESAEDRQDFWILLRALAGVTPGESAPSREAIEQEVRREVVGKIAAGLMQLVGGEAAPIAREAAPEVKADAPPADSMAPWIDTEDCTSCDECINLNPKIFAYNDKKKAFIKNPDGGPYQDLVKAAEKCTAQVIHPGLPKDRSAKDIEKWIERGRKYN